MTPENCETKFRQQVDAAGVSLSQLLPETGVRLMLQFYENERANDCELDADGDMLLFQWGSNNWGDGLYFDLNITRQLIQEKDGEQCIRQLSLTFRHHAEPAFTEIESGNKWCPNPSGATEFGDWIQNSTAFQSCRSKTPIEIQLESRIA